MSHNSKTLDLAERSRKISKGQAKIFLTRSAGEEQRLTKLTQQLDKEKAARESQLSYAQKLLLKRYGGKVGEGGASESRSPTLVTRAYHHKEEKQPCPEVTGRARAASGSLCDLDARSKSTRGLVDIPRVHSQGNVSTGKYKDSCVSARRKISFGVGDLLKTQSNCSGSDGEIYKGSSKLDVSDQERRPRAVSEILPPISLPPIFKMDDNSKVKCKSNSGKTAAVLIGPGGRKTAVTGKTTGRIGGPNKVLHAQTPPVTRKTPRDSRNIPGSIEDKTMEADLRDCRYLRTRNLED